MSTCPVCNGPMKPLFTGSFCPKDCDRPNHKAAEIAVAQDLIAKPKAWVTANANVIPWGGGWGFPTMSKYVPAKGQCPDAMCRGKGVHQYSSFTTDTNNVTTGRDHYSCGICSKPFFEENNSGIPSSIP